MLDRAQFFLVGGSCLNSFLREREGREGERERALLFWTFSDPGEQRDSAIPNYAAISKRGWEAGSISLLSYQGPVKL